MDSVTRARERFPEKWMPVFRRKCHQYEVLDRIAIRSNRDAV
jgi:hypothetical protein